MGAQGTVSLDFGVFPGGSDASVVITGQTSILAGSLVEAWILPADTADHTVDEHLVETLSILAGNIVAGTGFTIYGINTSQLNEPITIKQHEGSLHQANATTIVYKVAARGAGPAQDGGIGTRLYGVFNIGWVWN